MAALASVVVLVQEVLVARNSSGMANVIEEGDLGYEN